MNKVIKNEGPDPTLDVTKFVNVDSKPYDIYIEGKVTRHFEAGEEKSVPVFVGQVGAKHLIDRILQEKGVKDTNRDTDERRSLFAQILPDWAEEIQVKPQTQEQFNDGIKKQLDDQKIALDALLAEGKKAEGKKDEEIAKLKKELVEANKPKVTTKKK